MKIKILGSSACEGIPAIFCNCPICSEARKRGEKNIRTRNQVLINDDMLIDFPADTYMHVLANNIDLSAIKTLLITHSHHDHFYPYEFPLRGICYAQNITSPEFNIFCNKKVEKIFKTQLKDEMVKEVMDHIHIQNPKFYQPFNDGKYKIIALPAEHSEEESIIYLISQQNKTFFFCSDTGILFDEIYNFLIEKHIHIDAICLDCTMGNLIVGKGKGHMGFADAKTVVDRMIKDKIISLDTKVIMTHFSHYGQMLYEDCLEKCQNTNIMSAYDGMEIEI